MLSKKRIARAAPFAALFGTLLTGLLALTGVVPAEAFNYAIAGVCVFFLTRWFSRKFRQYGRYMRKESAAQRRDRRRAIRKASIPMGR